MKKWAITLLCILIITASGCNASTIDNWLVLGDEVPVEDTALHYSVQLEIPDGCALTAATDAARKVYEAEDGSYSVIAQTFLQTSAQDAIKQMSGFDAEQLAVIVSQRFSMPEYRFTWTAAGETGLLLCTGMVLADANACYTLQFCVQEDAAKACSDIKQEIFSSYGLYCDEGC